MSIQTAYNDWAGSYDQDYNLTRDLDAVFTRQLLQPLRFQTILEAGCGTGKNTAFFSHLCSRLVAMDFSRGMLEKARAKLSLPNVSFVMSDLLGSFPLPSASCDLVTFNLVLEHIQDLGAVFAEAARILRPGGMLLVSELHPFRQYGGSKAAFVNRASGELPTETEIPAFVHHISDFIQAAGSNGLKLEQFQEAWHKQDEGKAPRLAVFLFTR